MGKRCGACGLAVAKRQWEVDREWCDAAHAIERPRVLAFCNQNGDFRSPREHSEPRRRVDCEHLEPKMPPNPARLQDIPPQHLSARRRLADRDQLVGRDQLGDVIDERVELANCLSPRTTMPFDEPCARERGDVIRCESAGTQVPNHQLHVVQATRISRSHHTVIKDNWTMSLPADSFSTREPAQAAMELAV